MMDGFFWLHIKKSAGQTMRARLDPIYVETKGLRLPRQITELPAENWNQALNNYRADLGPYQFRRSEFARRILWPDSWKDKMSLAFSRNPVDRCVSMFDYMFNPVVRPRNLRLYFRFVRSCPSLPTLRKLTWSTSRSFDLFLEALDWQASLRDSGDPSQPLGLHFSTHTNPMSLDVHDDAGKSNLSHIYRLEALDQGLDAAFSHMGLERSQAPAVRLNSHGTARRHRVTAAQLRRIERLYGQDFDIYENALTS